MLIFRAVGLSVFFSFLVSSFSMQVGGTTPRQEIEDKVSYSASYKVDFKRLSKNIEKELHQLIHSDKLSFPKFADTKYYLDEKFDTFLFKDIYLDTEDLLLHKNKSSYRLRYRWKSRKKYLEYRKGSKKKKNFPYRCEIQFKTNHTDAYGSGTLYSRLLETRIEFSNEVEPFKSNKDAPKPPWPEKEYIGYAKKGEYKKYKLSPSIELMKVAGKGFKKIADIPLEPIIYLETLRTRIHLNASNKWGYGVNIDQVFIITIDQAKPIKSMLGIPVFSKNNLVEIEIEIDQNVTTRLLKILKNPHNMGFKEATLAMNALQKDLKTIKKEIDQLLRVKLKLKPLKLKSKHSRFLKTR